MSRQHVIVVACLLTAFNGFTGVQSFRNMADSDAVDETTIVFPIGSVVNLKPPSRACAASFEQVFGVVYKQKINQNRANGDSDYYNYKICIGTTEVPKEKLWGGHICPNKCEVNGGELVLRKPCLPGEDGVAFYPHSRFKVGCDLESGSQPKLAYKLSQMVEAAQKRPSDYGNWDYEDQMALYVLEAAEAAEVKGKRGDLLLLTARGSMASEHCILARGELVIKTKNSRGGENMAVFQLSGAYILAGRNDGEFVLSSADGNQMFDAGSREARDSWITAFEEQAAE